VLFSLARRGRKKRRRGSWSPCTKWSSSSNSRSSQQQTTHWY